MIREKTILCKLNQIKVSDRQLLEAMTPSYGKCPGCGARGECRLHATYNRHMTSIEGEVRIDGEIAVQRVACSSCGKTHALLSDLLIPFGSYSLRFVLHVLKAYLTRNGTVHALCEAFAIAVSTLYKWIHLFQKHANLLLSSFEQARWVAMPVLLFVEGLPCLPSLFFRRFRFSFLQGHARQAAVAKPV